MILLKLYYYTIVNIKIKFKNNKSKNKIIFRVFLFPFIFLVQLVKTVNSNIISFVKIVKKKCVRNGDVLLKISHKYTVGNEEQFDIKKREEKGNQKVFESYSKKIVRMEIG